MPVLRAQAIRGRPVELRLSRDLVRLLRRGHPWVFADALAKRPDAPVGSVAKLLDKQGRRVVAWGFYDSEGGLAFRACVAERRAMLDASWAEGRLDRALALRRGLFDGQTTAYRLVNGEGDGMPGLVVDVYGDTAVLKLDGPGPEGFWDAEAIAAALVARLEGLERVYQRMRTKGGPSGRPLVGAAPAADVRFVENGLSFAADVVRGQKTGFFLDQRDNRQRVRGLARGRSVLNVFGYTGGFSVYAGAGGATDVTTVDIAPPAIAAAEANWALNGLAPGAHEGAAGDAFAFLERAERRWGIVILDPPSFAKQRKQVPAALSAYKRLIAAGARVVEPGGLLAASSCTSQVGAEAFLDVCREGIGQARRVGTLLAIHDQPADHPSPLACPELRYLKFVLMRLD